MAVSRMETPTLVTIPAEVIHYLSSFLWEEDLEALSLTCVFIYDALNINSVWKRFLTQQVRDLLSQNQLIDPPFVPDPDMCENHRLVLMKNHLISNWRKGKWVEYSTKTNFCYLSIFFLDPKGSGQLIYKENYIFLGRYTSNIDWEAIEVWDISKEPVLLSVIPIKDEYDSFYLIEDTVVVVGCSRVHVYEINIESKEFPLLYSFLFTEDEVVWSKPQFHNHNMRCAGWSHYKVGNYLVSNKCEDEPHYPVLHVWDIPNACKVGAFVSPMEGFSLAVNHFENSDWYLCLNRQSGLKLYYFKFNVRSKKFSDIGFEYDGPYPKHVLFHKDRLIMFKNADSGNRYDSVCEIYDLNSSTKLQERRFDNANQNSYLESTIIVDGKFVILCKGNFLVVDATTLATVDSIPCDSNIRFIVKQFNVFGTVFVVTSEKNNGKHIWDIEKKKKVFTPLKNGYKYNHLYVNKSSTRLICLICQRHEMLFMSFW